MAYLIYNIKEFLKQGGSVAFKVIHNKNIYKLYKYYFLDLSFYLLQTFFTSFYKLF